MPPQGPNPYLKTKVMTASPEELRLMLYDGALKFCRQGIKSLDEKDYEASYNNLMRAQKIVLELSTSLKHNVAPELCEKLSALYTYVYRRLVDANMNRDIDAVKEAIELITYERETWDMLMQKIAQGQDPTASAGDMASTRMPNLTGAQQTAISSLSMQG